MYIKKENNITKLYNDCVIKVLNRLSNKIVITNNKSILNNNKTRTIINKLNKSVKM